MFCVWNANFIDFLWHSYYLHRGVRRSVICSDFIKITCKNKCRIQVITKNMPPKRFWILEISFIRKNVEHSQNERVKWFIKKEMKKWIIKTHCSEENLTSILYDSLILELWYKRNVINKETTSLKNNISYLSHGIKIIHRSQLHQ